MSSLLGNFLTNIGGQMRDKENKANEDAQWEKRQRLMADLEVERDSKLAKNKRKDGNTYKDQSGQWVTEVLDGNGNVVSTRAATQSEVADSENVGYVAEGNKYQAQRGKKQLDTFDEDRALDIQEKKQRMSIDREQNARGWAAEARMSNDSKESKAAAKRDSKEQEQGVKDARQALADVASIPVTDPSDPQVRKLYDEINLLMATKPLGFRSRIKMIQAQARRLASSRAKDGGTESAGSPLDPNL